MSERSRGYKLLISYDVKQENLNAYYQFVLGRYIPVMQALGLEMNEAWHTAYGNWPNRLVGFVARDLKSVDELLNGETWAELNDQLEEYVSEFRYKIIPYEEGFQL
jgi:hypothetical protein